MKRIGITGPTGAGKTTALQALVELDHDKRVEMYRDIQQQVYDNANVIPLYRNDFAFARSAKVDGLQVNPFYVYQAMYWTKAN